MKIHITGLIATALCLALASADAQPGRPGGMGGGMGGPQNGAQISAAMAKLFGENQAFSATVENEVQMSKGGTMTMPGKIAFDSGRARFEMNMSEAKGSAMPPQAAAQMKSMGMDNMITISRPDLKVNYIIYPGLKAYAEMATQDADATKRATDFKMETTELGKETMDGHPCVKNKAIVTDDQGKAHESTVWNATDLKNFPVKIQTTEQGTGMTMVYKNVKLTKPDAGLFEPPAGFKKYANMMEMMQQEMMKRMSEGQGGMPPK
jgi:hypothetical protein